MQSEAQVSIIVTEKHTSYSIFCQIWYTGGCTLYS